MTPEYIFGLNAVELFILVFVISQVFGILYLVIIRKDAKQAQDNYLKIINDLQVKQAAQDVYNRQSVPIKQFIEVVESAFKLVGMVNLPVIDTAIDATGEFIEDMTEDYQMDTNPVSQKG